MSNGLILFEKDNMDKIVKASNMLAKSSIIPYALRGKVEDVFAIITMGAELGMSPMKALNTINVIQGKTAMGAQLMMGLVLSKLPEADFQIEQDDEKKSVTVTAVRSKNATPYVTTWDLAKAEALGLAKKDNYQKQLMTMLRWRAISECCRIIAPDILTGFYALEEFQDMDGKEIRVVENEAENLEEDFSIPEEEKKVGPLYRFQNGKFRGMQTKDLDWEMANEYKETLLKRSDKGLKDWENEALTVLSDYCENYDAYKEIAEEAATD